MKLFQEQAVGRWFTQAWKNKIAGAFTNSTNFSGDKLNTLVGLMINAMQQSMIFVGLGMLPASNDLASFDTLEGPGPDALNRVDASIGPMAVSFTVAAGDAPPTGDIQTAAAYGRRIAEITAQFLRGRS
jgi:NAD(P)H dehydrogenase (quinone)